MDKKRIKLGEARIEDIQRVPAFLSHIQILEIKIAELKKEFKLEVNVSDQNFRYCRTHLSKATEYVEKLEEKVKKLEERVEVLTETLFPSK
jgi:archaellum component FlaC